MVYIYAHWIKPVKIMRYFIWRVYLVAYTYKNNKTLCYKLYKDAHKVLHLSIYNVCHEIK